MRSAFVFFFLCFDVVRSCQSAFNGQPWRLVVVPNKEHNKDLSLPVDVDRTNTIIHFMSLPPAIPELPDTDPSAWVNVDVGCAVFSFSVIASECGLNGCWKISEMDEELLKKSMGCFSKDVKYVVSWVCDE